MNDQATRFVEKPRVRPKNARFSSGPCRKHPGWNPSQFDLSHLGRSHRAAEPKARLNQAITRSAELLGLPVDWKLGIVPGSDTGAFEMAMWSLLGERPVDALVWESFSNDWANDLSTLFTAGPALNIYQADYGTLPDLNQVDSAHDVVMVYNGTTSGVRLPDLDWLDSHRDGLVLCDATSAAFAMPLDFAKLDVVTWSWQKVLGGEAAHGMLALSPKAQARLASAPPPRPLPKLFRLTKNQHLIDGIFRGETINTPSMLAVEDLHSALDWADSIGGLAALHERSQENFAALDHWVERSDWAAWLATAPATRSSTAMCLKIIAPKFTVLQDSEQQRWVKTLCSWLADQGVAFDIANYRSAPPGFRIWGGATVEADDVRQLCAWLDWAYRSAELQITNGDAQHV